MHPIFILSWPAGVGKTSLWNAIAPSLPHVERVITTTSRPIRPGEQDGRDYYFLSPEAFRSGIKRWDFLEYATVHGNHYGSTYAELDRILASHHAPMYIIEPQGMHHLKPLIEARGNSVHTIFLLPPSFEVLKDRLAGRGTETPEQYEIRIQTAITELAQKDAYDHHIINDDFHHASTTLISLIQWLSSPIVPHRRS